MQRRLFLTLAVAFQCRICTSTTLVIITTEFSGNAASMVCSCTNSTNSTPGDDLVPFGTAEWWEYAGMSLGCVIVAALAAGLTMGMVGIDIFALHITGPQLALQRGACAITKRVGTLWLADEADEEDCATDDERRQLRREKKWVRRLLPLKSRHHWLLVTLLLMNAGANEALPLFLDRLVPTWASVIVSVTFVLIFGEIIPSAIFTVRYLCT
jgi:hypothetical protein